MLYQVNITVPAKTPKRNPKVATLKVEEDIITKIGVYFPPGCCNLVKVAVFHGEDQIFPHKEYDWLSSDGYLIEGELYYDISYKPYPLTIKCYNEDEVFSHTVVIYVTSIEKEYVKLYEAIRDLSKVMKRLYWVFTGEEIG